MNFDTLENIPTDALKDKIVAYKKLRNEAKPCVNEFIDITKISISNQKLWFIKNISHFIEEGKKIESIPQLRNNQSNEVFSLLLEAFILFETNINQMRNKKTKLDNLGEKSKNLIVDEKKISKEINNIFNSFVKSAIGFGISFAVTAVNVFFYSFKQSNSNQNNNDIGYLICAGFFSVGVVGLSYFGYKSKTHYNNLLKINKDINRLLESTSKLNEDLKSCFESLLILDENTIDPSQSSKNFKNQS